MGRTSLDRETMLRAAFFEALRRRVARGEDGLITVPTGIVKTEELRQVLHAIEKSSQE
jgi:hypothetical protein